MESKYIGDGTIDGIFFISGGGSSMEAVLESPNYGKNYRILMAITNTPEADSKKGRAIADAHDVHVEFVDPRDYPTREEFYEKGILPIINETKASFIGLSGWLKAYSIIPKTFLEKAPPVINVHPMNLGIIARLMGRKPIDMGRDVISHTKRDVSSYPYDQANVIVGDTTEWERLYTGDDAVSMSALFGESEVCSSIHRISAKEPKVDHGPMVVRSRDERVDREYVEKQIARNAYNMVIKYGKELQEITKTKCDGPAFCKALELMSKGMELFDDHVEIEGNPLPYGGYKMD
jgi:folate-dependent phosphoribosylglycinamide formyltransferase PurN